MWSSGFELVIFRPTWSADFFSSIVSAGPSLAHSGIILSGPSCTRSWASNYISTKETFNSAISDAQISDLLFDSNFEIWIWAESNHHIASSGYLFACIDELKQSNFGHLK